MPRPFDRGAFTSRLRQARLRAYEEGGIPLLADGAGDTLEDLVKL